MPKTFTSKDWSPATQMVHGGTLRSQFNENSESIFLTQGHVYESMEEAEARFKGAPGYIYARFSNPTVNMFEQRMCQLEGAEAARATATGMAAVTATMMSLVAKGDHIVAAKALFGSCRYVIETLLPKFGVEFTLVDGYDLKQWEQAVKKNTKVFFLESPTNPTLEVYDIAAIAQISKACKAKLVIDNVFATALWQSPLKLGADVVVYSTTKHIDGGGRTLGGIILSSEQIINDYVHTFLRQTGPAMSPFTAWVQLKALESFAPRVKQQTQNAAEVADALANMKNIERVFYPHRKDHPQYDIAKKQMKAGSTLIAFNVKGGKEGAFKAANKLKIIRISNNLGDAKSLITHPSTTTHERFTAEQRQEMGIGDGLLRLSVGLEEASDLIRDLEIALS